MGLARLRFFAAPCALGLALAIVAGSIGPFASRAYAAGTLLTVLSDDVSVRHSGADFHAAHDGDVLDEGDVIRTGDSGRAVLTYFDGSTVTIEPASELSIDRASPLADHGKAIEMTQIFGRTWHVVTKLLTALSRYEVRTPASTASVRGTQFEVNASDRETTVTTSEGLVVQHVPDPDRPGTFVDVNVPAGTTQTQHRDAAPEPSRTTPKAAAVVIAGADDKGPTEEKARGNAASKDGGAASDARGASDARAASHVDEHASVPNTKESAKDNGPKNDGVKTDVRTNEGAKKNDGVKNNEAAKSDVRTNDGAKNDVVKNNEGAKNDVVKNNENAKNDVVKNNENAKNEGPKNDIVKNEPVKNEPLKNEPVKSESPKTEPVKSEGPRNDAARNESAKTVPDRPEVKADPPRGGGDGPKAAGAPKAPDIARGDPRRDPDVQRHESRSSRR